MYDNSNLSILWYTAVHIFSWYPALQNIDMEPKVVYMYIYIVCDKSRGCFILYWKNWNSSSRTFSLFFREYNSTIIVSINKLCLCY